MGSEPQSRARQVGLASMMVQYREICLYPKLNTMYSVRMKKPWVLIYQLSAQRRLWSDWADA